MQQAKHSVDLFLQHTTKEYSCENDARELSSDYGFMFVGTSYRKSKALQQSGWGRSSY